MERRSLLSKINIPLQRLGGRRGMTFPFCGEPFDKLKALSKVEGRPPNKKHSSMSKHTLAFFASAINLNERRSDELLV
jgi:hypothetical protein